MRARRIKSGGHIWTIKWVGETELGRLLGLTDLETLTIFIRSDISLSLQRETLLHELHHVALYDALPVDAQENDVEAETFICATSSGLYEIMKRNRWARKYVWGW